MEKNASNNNTCKSIFKDGDSIARALLPDIVEFFSSEEGKRVAEELEKRKKAKK